LQAYPNVVPTVVTGILNQNDYKIHDTIKHSHEEHKKSPDDYSSGLFS